MLNHIRLVTVALVMLSALGILACPVRAQDTAAGAGEKTAAVAGGEGQAAEKLRSQWSDMLHYVRMARPKLAISYAQGILKAATPEEIYRLSVAVKGSQGILTRGMGSKELQDVIVEIRKRINQGYQAFRRNASEIKQTIETLGGNARAYARAKDRLVASGECALPQLLQVLLDPKITPMLRERVGEVLPGAGKENVRGLAEATQSVNTRLVQEAATALGRIRYGHAIPQLRELYARKNLTPSTRKIVAMALISCAGGDQGVLTKPPAELYYRAAVKYYQRHESVLPDSRYATANVWYFRDELLTSKPVPREIFCDIYAMRMARKALEADPKYSPAVSLWLSAYLRRELDLPAGQSDPLLGAGQPAAGDYVRAAGAAYAQQVLARGLDEGHSGVAIAAIKALRDVAGAKNLVKGLEEGSAQPLVEAMGYPDRRVRFLAAEVLALAMPEEKYSGDRIVVSALMDALRQVGASRAILIAGEGEKRNLLKDALRGQKYTVIAEGAPIAALAAARKAGGADLVVVAEARQVSRSVDLVRRDPRMAAVPVIAMGSVGDFGEMAAADGKVVLVPPAADVSVVVEALPKAAALASGKTLSAEEASDWAVRAAKAIRMLGLTGNKVYAIAPALDTLIAALKDNRPAVRIASARAMAVISDAHGQQATAALADGATDTKVRIAAYGALSESVRRYGNALTSAQSQAVVDVVNSKAARSIRRAAAQVLGALDLASDQITPLIRDAAGGD